MSLVTDHISKIDSQLDKIQLLRHPSAPSSPELHSASDEPSSQASGPSNDSNLGRILALQAVIKTFSTASSSRTTLDPLTILSLLEQARLSVSDTTENVEFSTIQQQGLEWVVVSKATAQAYGLILNTLLDQTFPLDRDIGYWNEVLGSYQYLSLYTVQTSPLRLWACWKDIYSDVRERMQSTQDIEDRGESDNSTTLADMWRRFYGLVRDTVRDRTLADVQSRVLSPVTRSRIEVSSKRKQLKRLRELSASGLGILMDEGMIFDIEEEGSVSSKDRSGGKDEWRSVVSKSVFLMEMVLLNITTLEMGTNEMEESVFQSIDDDADSETADIGATARIAARLEQILRIHLPAHTAATADLTRQFGRPSRLIRYWLPLTAVLLSSSTLLRIFINRKAEITTWVRDFGTTTIDFWNNWVVEPVRKVVGTIRHDKDSEIAIMSKESLQGDRASLERMVVDFAVDNPNTSTGTPLTDADVANVRAKVKEGDLTPVLVAYEKDLRKPFVGTIRGDLVRALLIQIQKTKVDVEVAVGGIDNLLKSQELVFGFVGLTPGLLVCFGVLRWLNGLGAGRQGRLQGRKQGSMIRNLRNIDRTLAGARPTENGMLSYKDHGMLLCEVHILRQRAQKIFPGEINNELLEEINDLIDLHTGIDRQIHIVERIRWAYSKWLH